MSKWNTFNLNISFILSAKLCFESNKISSEMKNSRRHANYEIFGNFSKMTLEMALRRNQQHFWEKTTRTHTQIDVTLPWKSSFNNVVLDLRSAYDFPASFPFALCSVLFFLFVFIVALNSYIEFSIDFHWKDII